MRAARDAELDVVAVTDHNTAAWVEEVTHAAAGAGLTVIPGVELTVSDGTHLLALFAPGTTTDRISAFLGACGHHEPGRDTPATCSYVEALTKAADEAVFLAPHITSAKGIFRQLGFGQPLMKILRSRHLDGVEVNDDFAGLGGEDEEKLLRALRGELADYRRPRGPLPILVSSDAHELEAIGRRFTWIKMTRPTVEGLRLALQDGQPLSVRNEMDGGTEDPNRHASCVIEGIEVEDLRYMGRGKPFEARFNPWLNTIVGGRGTGKSTLVECLRLCLRRRDELPDDLEEDLAHFYSTYESRDDRGLLTPDSEIRVVYRKDDQRFRLRWRQDGEGESIEREIASGDWQPEHGVVQERFPVRLYSQKQVFELARDPAALLHIVDEAQEVAYGDWKAEWDRKVSRYLSLRARIRELRNRLDREASLRGEHADLVHKLEIFEEGGHAEVLRRYQHRRRELREVERWFGELETLGSRLREATEELAVDAPDTASWREEKGREQVAGLIDAVSGDLQGCQEQILAVAGEIDERVERAKKDFEESAWRAAARQATVEYESLKERLTEGGVEDPAEYGRLVQRRQGVEEELASLRDLRREVSGLEEEAEQLRVDLGDHRREITERRQRFLETVLPEGEGLVEARIVAYGDRGSVETELRELLEKRDHYEKDIGSPGSGEGILGRLYPDRDDTGSEEGDGTWSRGFEERLETAKAQLVGIHEGGRGDALRDRRLADHLRSLPPERIDRLRIWFPSDALEIRYSPTGDGRGFRSIDQASPGQKTAALLTFLLSYGDEPIVLDQPEDDLDNHLIYDLLVKRIRDMKVERQVIVVTHNPNIVVHGDAELVISLDQRKGCTQAIATGGLQESRVRSEVCRVMEGGEEALRRRYQRIAENPVVRGEAG